MRGADDRDMSTPILTSTLIRLPEYVAVAERDGLDFAIGSKTPPGLRRVSYPCARRIASWLFQRYVKLLLQLRTSEIRS